MKKIFKYVAIATTVLLFAACSKEDMNINGKTVSDTFDRDGFAAAFCQKLGNSQSAYQELQNAIKQVHSYGIDEYVYAYDIINTTQSVFFQSNYSFTNLRTFFTTSKMSAYGLSASNYYDNMIVYWPYHDDWDETTIPTVCFAPADETTTTVNGYRSDGTTVTVPLGDIDNLSYPLIIIDFGERDYSVYPAFKNGVYTKNGVQWIGGLEEEGGDVATPFTTVYRGLFTKFVCYKQYDFLGGSEFMFKIRYVQDGVIKEVERNVDFTRKQIRDTVTKVLNITAHPNWQPNCGDIYMYAYEDDGGDLDVNINFTLTYGGATLSGNISKSDKDDVLFNGPIDRNDFIYISNSPTNFFVLGACYLYNATQIYTV